MKYIGLAVAIGALFCFMRLYLKSLSARRLCYLEISMLIGHISEGLRTKRETLPELCSEVECIQLSECGFIHLAIEEGRLEEGVGCLTLDGADRVKLLEFLSGFGEGYLDTELKRAEGAFSHFEKRAETENKEYPNKRRIALLLFCSFAVSLALLCI